MQQVMHWKGEEGDSYIERNTVKDLVPAYSAMWSRILPKTRGVKSVLEVGANVGANLRAIRYLDPQIECAGIEPNKAARSELESAGFDCYAKTAEEPWGLAAYDLVFTRGVLIHINPAVLHLVYENMHKHSTRYIVMAEYFAPKREMIPYRGKDNLLWRADYAGEIMDAYPGLKLVDYFFIYKRDLLSPQDNITVFLMEKT